MCVVAQHPITDTIASLATMKAMFAEKIVVKLVWGASDCCLPVINPIGVASDNRAKIGRVTWVMFELLESQNKRRLMPS